MNRYSDALAIQSACNVAGIARALVKACDAVHAEDGKTQDDPAVALIVYQLAYLCKVGELHMTTERYSELTKVCEENSNDT